MKRKILAVFLMLVMTITMIPANITKAEDVDILPLAKDLVDTILEGAPTPEEYTEDMAEPIVSFGEYLAVMEAADLAELDTYITEKTKSEDGTFSSYTSAEMFYGQYKAVHDEYMEAEAVELIALINELMKSPLTRSAYESVKTEYDAASEYVMVYVREDEAGNSFNQLHELMDRADKAIEVIEEITSLTTESDYDRFSKTMDAADSAVDLYYSKFSDLRSYGKYANCLPRDIRNTLLTNYGKYEKASLIYAVEKAYYSIGDFEVMTDAVKEEILAMKEALTAADDSEYNISVYDFYNGEEMKLLLNQYENLTELESRLDILPDNLSNTTELAAALRAYEYYANMTEEEKAMVPKEDLDKMLDALTISTACDEVIDVVDKIGTVKGEEEFSEYVKRYEKAYETYQSFINQYRGISGIDELITNVEVLDNATRVLELVRSIKKLSEEEDAIMCSHLIQMEALRSEYQSMSAEMRVQIYNIDVLNQLYEDTQNAFAVKTKIEAIRNNFTLEDEEYIKQVRKEYDALTEKAKAYVGESKYLSLALAERQVQALHENVAEQVISKIKAIGNVGVSSKDIILATRSSYDALTDYQKSLVTNYQDLVTAESAYALYETSIAKAEVSGLENYTYSGAAIKPLLTVKLNGTVLVPELDYTTTYNFNVNAGTAKVTINGIGMYHGQQFKTFAIRSRTLATARVTGYSSNYSYTGNKIIPALNVYMDNVLLKKDTDYVVSYYHNKNAGRAFMVITGKGNYSGSTTVSFKISKVSLKKAKVSGLKKSYKYKKGKKICPKFTLKLNGKKLKKGRDYKVTYKKNKKKGKAVAVITGKGNYSGTKKVKYKIS